MPILAYGPPGPMLSLWYLIGGIRFFTRPLAEIRYLPLLLHPVAARASVRLPAVPRSSLELMRRGMDRDSFVNSVSQSVRRR